MKIFFLCFALFSIAFSPVWSISSGEDLLRDMRLKIIQDYIEQNHQLNQIIEKLETICPGYRSEFEVAFKRIQSCTDSIDETQETICSTVKNHFAKCTKPLVAVFEKCLPDKSKDLPSFFVQTLVSTSNHFCKSDGEHIFELSNPCVLTESYRMKRCMLKVQSKFQQYMRNVPSKMEICDFIRSLKGCFKSHLSLTCGNPITREAFMDLFETSMKQCDDGNTSSEIEVFEITGNVIPDNM